MIPFQSHQIYSSTFLAVSYGLATIWTASPRFDLVQIVTHFSFSVTIRLKNGLISFRLSKTLKMEIRCVNRYGTQTSSFILNSTSYSLKLFMADLTCRGNLDYFCDFIDIFDDAPTCVMYTFNIESV